MAKAGSTVDASKTWDTKTNASQNGLDATATDWRNQTWDATQAAAGAGVPQSVQDAMAQYAQMMKGGNLGLSAMGGDKSAVDQLSSPYTQNVIDANSNDWNRVNAQTQMGVNAAATGAGAFGGSRYGVALGSALGANNAAQMTQSAGLRQAGYSDAMMRAQQMANFGMGAAGASAQLGQYAGNPSLWSANVLKQGLLGMPYGTNTSGTTGATNSRLAGQWTGSVGF